jgi:hypothetical protein
MRRWHREGAHEVLDGRPLPGVDIVQRLGRRGHCGSSLALPDLLPDGALVGREHVVRAHLLGDHAPQHMVNRAGRAEVAAPTPSVHLQARDGNGGCGGGLEKDRDVDDPVLGTANDGVAAQDQHRRRANAGLHGRHRLDGGLMNLDGSPRGRLVEGLVFGLAVRQARCECDDG